MGPANLSPEDLNDDEIAALSPLEVKKIIFDLQTHKFELQMQNEELRASRLELEKARDDYLDLYESSPVAYFTLDREGIILKANQAACDLIGEDKRSLLSKPLSNYIAAPYKVVLSQHIESVLDNNPDEMSEVCLDSAGQSGIYLELHSSRIGGDRRLIKTAAVDITERKKAEIIMTRANTILEERVNNRTAELHESNAYLQHEIQLHKAARDELNRVVEELERSNAELTQFAYVASHDLQEPLRNIVTSLQVLERKLADGNEADAEKFLNFAVESAKRMSNLIHALLEYSRVGRGEQQFQETNSSEIIATALHMLRSTIEENNAEVSYGKLPKIVANPTQLIQLFQNLIGNSIKFRSAHPPLVTVSAHETADEWMFTIADNGIGIKPEYLERIFVIFQRLHTRDEFPGTGIGLSIARKIVTNHLGRIWVESKPGKGSLFYFTIKKSLKAAHMTNKGISEK